MDLKITKEAWGGFKTFDAISYYCLIFLLKDFLTIDKKNRTNFYFVLFVLFSVIVLIGGLASEFPDKTFLNLVKIFPVFIYARFFIKECYLDPSFQARAVKAVKISYTAALIFLFIQWVVGLRFTFYPELGPNTFDATLNLIRYPGVFYDSQASGQFLAMGCFVFLFNAKDATKKNLSINYILFALSITGIFLAGSRAAFGGFIVGLLVVFFMAANKYRIYGVFLIFIVAAAYMFVAPNKGVFARTANISEDYLFRKSIWEKAIEISKEHPYLGIGMENYQKYVMRHAQDQYLEINEGELLYFSQPENGYLKIMVELGFTGFIIFMFFLTVPVITGMIYKIIGWVDYRISFFVASLICFLVEFNTVYSIWDNRILLLVVTMIALIVSYPMTPVKNDEIVGSYVK
ncbi:O-antigen ligase family protein [Mucilaginibacter aquariorum]|uniref:O-antigen ligase family protein n=1 Tax=Mucilaginibacter aquariorum TaxID=2967225 RepID=A0ABT1SVU2_9SPHI|nr:O-antigen ligase family protein [Mucilaginibacter aquariorum]MCQ6956323.1 O-antigen ligase family protein [Mucilaginibacter aquariorum]